MSDWLQAILLGILQGITEFLPVSSSGHLVVAEKFLNVNSPGMFLEVMLHAGTLLSIVIYYFRDIITLVAGMLKSDRDSWREAGFILLSMLPAALAYLFFNDWVENELKSPYVAACMFCVTGLALISLRFATERKRDLGLLGAIGMGVAQAVAMLPGISRSGSTICVARHMGVEPHRAAKFSLLMVVPVIFGATLMQVYDLVKAGASAPADGMRLLPLLLGAAVAAVVGYLAICTLVRILSAGRFWFFGVYCLLLGIVLIATL